MAWPMEEPTATPLRDEELAKVLEKWQVGQDTAREG